MSERERLFEAFLAGFETSGEGLNGEYRAANLCGPYYDSEGGKRFIDYMLPRFEKWLKQEGK